jgi:lysophospholipase L1-like esterase
MERRCKALCRRENLLVSRSTKTLAQIGLLLGSIVTVMPATSASEDHWVEAWAAPPDQAGPVLEPQTLRQIIRTSIGGSSVRIRLSNLFGSAAVTIGPVHIAAHASGSAIRPETDHVVTFDGKSVVTIPKETDALSDPVNFPVTALEELAVSLYLPRNTAPSTLHGVGMQTVFITKKRDVTAATEFSVGPTDDSRYFLTDVEVIAEARTLVILGDSTSDGVGSRQDHNTRWPDVLASRLQADSKLSSIAVVNSGIAGNRILNDGAEPFIGPSMLSRFDRDALSKPGVSCILLSAGGNDISAANALTTPKDKVSAQQVIDGMKALIARAHERGVEIWGATLLPLDGAEAPFSSAEGEEKRELVNAWIRTAGAFDAVIDFNRITRDPAHPTHLLPAFDSGDHVHPNEAGYRAMAASIDSALLMRIK